MCVWELEDKSFMLVWEHLQIYWGFGFVNVYCVCEVHESSCNLYFYSKFCLGQEKIISFGLQRGKKKWQSNLPTQSMTSSVHSDRVLKREKKKPTCLSTRNSQYFINSSFDYKNPLCKNHNLKLGLLLWLVDQTLIESNQSTHIKTNVPQYSILKTLMILLINSVYSLSRLNINTCKDSFLY